jgi:hypothetical protein
MVYYRAAISKYFHHSRRTKLSQQRSTNKVYKVLLTVNYKVALIVLSQYFITKYTNESLVSVRHGSAMSMVKMFWVWVW